MYSLYDSLIQSIFCLYVIHRSVVADSRFVSNIATEIHWSFSALFQIDVWNIISVSNIKRGDTSRIILEVPKTTIQQHDCNTVSFKEPGKLRTVFEYTKWASS